MALESQIRQYTSLPSCYVHHSDVRSIPSLNGRMILAVKAARGAEVHMDPAPGQNRMTLRSETEVDVYVLTTDSGAGMQDGSMMEPDYGRPPMELMQTPQRRKSPPNGMDIKQDENSLGIPRLHDGMLAEPTLGSLVHIADAASNQAPVPLSLTHDTLKTSPSSSLLNPPSPISPTRNGVLIPGLPMDDNFGFGSNIFNSSPTRTSPGHKGGIPSPSSSNMMGNLGSDMMGQMSSAPGAHMLSSTPLASKMSAAVGSSGFASPTHRFGLFSGNGQVDPLSPGPNFHDDSALPGMLNSKALGRGETSRTGSDGSSNGLDGGLVGSTLGLATPGTLPSLKSEMSNDSSPFKPSRRAAWPTTPDVSSTGFDDYHLDANTSPSKRLALTPTSSPEKRQFPFGSPDQLEGQDTFAFFPESSIGLPPHSRR